MKKPASLKLFHLLAFLFAFFTLVGISKGSAQNLKDAGADITTSQSAGAPSDAKNKKRKKILTFSGRFIVGSPTHTFGSEDTGENPFKDFNAINLGAGAKLQFFNSIYGEYNILYNFYRQRTNQAIVGVETPTKGIRLGVRYLLSGDTYLFKKPNREGDLQAYLNLGGHRGGIEVGMGGLVDIIQGKQDFPTDFDEVDLHDIYVRINIPIWGQKNP